MEKKLIFLLMFVMMISLVSAQPPFQAEAGTDEGLTLRFPPVEAIKIGRDVTSHMHVHNSTNGLLLTNSSVDCFAHLYNSTGDHLLTEEMSFDGNGADFKLLILGGNFTKRERQSFIIWCNSTTAGGFVSGSFEVTATGQDLTDAESIFYVGLFGIIIFLFIVIFFGIGLLPNSNTKDEEGKLLSISYLKYVGYTLWFVEWILLIAILYVASNLAFAYLAEQLFAKTLFVFFQIALGLTPIIIAVLVVWLFVRIAHDRELYRMMERGLNQEHGGKF